MKTAAYILTWIAMAFSIAGIFAALSKRYRILHWSVGLMFIVLGMIILLDFKPLWFAVFSFVLLVLVGLMQIGFALRRAT